ncbi:spermatogenesis-associated protein 2 [Denticeps clupeoides]|uniref:Spermatogenesis-associated protein 2 PUB-like domain-containing protein n=1 Tax=Denticeps clupeoides TaxID=299321 RepID=A0AAY4CN52_9TELE|nr:spermatogenesis-associated protein 2-like [Denticeps clupeoides]
MTGGVGDVFRDYLDHYERPRDRGPVAACRSRPLAEKARRVLLAEPEPERRFSAFRFYRVALGCVRGAANRVAAVRVLLGATEVLEAMCVNLFLFPWKKEIRTIKTFTGPFVYCIQSVLPNDVTRGILESIGYYPQTDTEYRLSKSVDLDQARRMGFELFLARAECEYLLEAMAHRSHAECLEVLYRRAPGAEDAEEEDPRTQEASNQEERRNRPQQLEDPSLWEMREKYPDLAFQQKPIFAEGPPYPGPKGRAGDDPELAVRKQALICDLSGPQSMTVHPRGPNPVLSAPNLPEGEPQPLELGGYFPVAAHQEGSADDLPELAGRVGRLRVEERGADEPLKYPIEETAQAQPPRSACRNQVPSAPCSPRDKNQPGEDPIKEPPNSFYIPPSGLEDRGPLVGGEGKGHAQQSEDELLQTYVLVEAERK